MRILKKYPNRRLYDTRAERVRHARRRPQDDPRQRSRQSPRLENRQGPHPFRFAADHRRAGSRRTRAAVDQPRAGTGRPLLRRQHAERPQPLSRAEHHDVPRTAGALPAQDARGVEREPAEADAATRGSEHQLPEIVVARGHRNDARVRTEAEPHKDASEVHTTMPSADEDPSKSNHA